VLDRTEIREQPGVNLDDRLRSVPGFTLFRRSSSIVANPTTQGVSLRGLGSSGASRTLVLWDGIPINDPFGGWVYWTRVAPEEVERVEVSRGASTSVFGDRAMSGAIALFSRAPEPRRFSGGYEGGNLDTHIASGSGSHVWRSLGVSAAVRAATTDGYYIVPEAARGSVDRPANVRFVAGDTRVDYLGAESRMFVKLDLLAEDRDNGTALTYNSTSLGTLAGHYSRRWRSEDFSVLAYHTREVYRATFSSVTNNRNTEAITFFQRVPSEATGAAGMWRHSGAKWNLLAGADMQRVEGTSTDRVVPSGLRVGGGSQLQHGTFAQFDAGVSTAKLFLGLRHTFTGRDQRFLSPSAGFAIGRGRVRARGTTYRSFRAPTLNELHREFRVGNATTRANPDLRPEKMFGVETGVDVSVLETARASVTFFYHSLDDVITNVTLSTGAQTIRQRQNAASADARGVDVELRGRLGPVQGEVAYLFAESRFSNGLRIPQVPKHHGSAQLTWVHEGTLVSAGVRSYALQFEDDLNRFVLPGFATVQFVARQRVVSDLSASFSMENLLDREFAVGYTATTPACAGNRNCFTIGQPRMWRLGLRWN
jgi:outer membrane receptor protein involved in Fe transport